MSYDHQIFATIVARLRDVVPPDVEVRPESRIVGDLGLDSLAVMNFVMVLEDEFDISLTMDKLAKVDTVGDLAQALGSMISRVDE